jgi:hypothetical protein
MLQRQQFADLMKMEDILVYLLGIYLYRGQVNNFQKSFYVLLGPEIFEKAKERISPAGGFVDEQPIKKTKTTKKSTLKDSSQVFNTKGYKNCDDTDDDEEVDGFETEVKVKIKAEEVKPEF